MSKALELSHGLFVPIFGDRHPMTPGSNVDPRCIEMNLLQELLFAFASLRVPLASLGLRFAFHESLLPLDEIAVTKGRDASGSTLLNGITPCVSPMMFSRHPTGHAVKRGLIHQ
jgi:hypothetical protein